MENEEDEAPNLSNPCFRSEDDSLDLTTVTTYTTAAMHSHEEVQRNSELQCQSESSVAELSETQPAPEPQREQSLRGEKDGNGDPTGGEKEGDAEVDGSRLGGGEDDSRESRPPVSPVLPEPHQDQLIGEGRDGIEDSYGENMMAEAELDETKVGGGNESSELQQLVCPVIAEGNQAAAGVCGVEDVMNGGDFLVSSEENEDVVGKEGTHELDVKMENKVADMAEDTVGKADVVQKAEITDEAGVVGVGDKTEIAEEEEKDADMMKEIPKVEATMVDGTTDGNDIAEEKDADLYNETATAQGEAEATTGVADDKEKGEEADAAEDKEMQENMVVAQLAEQMDVGDGNGETEMQKEMEQEREKAEADVAEEIGVQEKMEVTNAAEEAESAEEIKEREVEVAGVAEEKVTGGAQLAEEMEKEKEEEVEVATQEEMEGGNTAGEVEVVEEMKDREEEEVEMDDVEEEPEEAHVVEEEEKDDAAEEMETEMETPEPVEEASKNVGGKRKRGKNSKSPSKASSKKKSEEDVCFICFDGGELVLCDRRGCPKAYHPSCVNRDEAFFKAKGRWNCGMIYSTAMLAGVDLCEGTGSKIFNFAQHNVQVLQAHEVGLLRVH